MRHFALITLLGTLGTMAPAFAQDLPHPAPQHLSRADAQTATLADLSVSHRVKTQAILANLKTGKITDVRLAAKQIDAILDANEARDILTVRDRFVREHRHMRRGQPNHRGGPIAQAPSQNMQPEGPPPGPDANPMAPRSDRESRDRPGMRNDAGLALIMITLDSRERHTLFERRRPA